MPTANGLAKSMGFTPLPEPKNTYFAVKPSLHSGTDLAVVLVLNPAKRQPGHFYYDITVAGRHRMHGYGDTAKVEDSLWWAMILYENADMEREADEVDSAPAQGRVAFR